MVPDTIEVFETVPFNITLTIIAPDTASIVLGIHKHSPYYIKKLTE